MAKKSGSSMPWLHSYKIKIPALLVVFFFLVISTMAVVLYVLGKDLLKEFAYDKAHHAGQQIINKLNARVTTATTLVGTLANLTAQLPADVERHKNLIANLINSQVKNNQDSENIITGAGIWPEPFQFDPNKERRSFFWGRDKTGKLTYFDNYNSQDGQGYHHEEWYVPAKYLSKGKTYWSKSYIDPYSLQPIVTVSTPMYQQEKLTGVVTIDLKLEGLRQLLAGVTQTFEGYAFIVDRQGFLLSFPDEKQVKAKRQESSSNSLEVYLNLDELVENTSQFANIAALLDKQNKLPRGVMSDDEHCVDDLSIKIAQESYQIELNQAKRIALSLCHPSQLIALPQQYFLDDDYFLNEEVFVSIITMAGTDWHIVTVLPYSAAIGPGINIYNQLLATAILAAFISLIISILLLRKFFKKLPHVSAFKKQRDDFSFISSADSTLPMPETVQALPIIGSWHWNIKKRSLWWSKEMYQFCGKTLSGFKPTLKYIVKYLIHPDDINNVLSIVKNAMKSQTPCGLEFRIVGKGQTVRYIHVQAKIVHNSTGQAVIVNGTVADITRQKQIQADWVFSTTISQTQDPVLVTDAQANILTVNNAFTEVTGYRPQEVLGKNPKFLKSGRHEPDFYQHLWDSLENNGQYEGEIWNRHKNGSIFPQRVTITATKDAQGKTINYIAIYAAISTINKDTAEVLNLAFYDPLTGLVNRRLLINRIEQEVKEAQRSQKIGALIFLDLDHFKALNDSLGHEYGDELLVQLGRRLVQEIRKEDTAARLGGDEFVLLLPAQKLSIEAALEHALIVAKKIKQSINQVFTLFDHQYELTASIGIAIFPDKILKPEDILHQADTAMYQAKKDGRNSICFFKPEMQKQADQRLQMQQALKQAIALDQYSLVYQPQVDTDGQCRGAEALIRWQHTEQGVILPNKFLSLAEQSGLSIVIGEWVINEACRQLRIWQQQGFQLDRLSINVSLKQFRHQDFSKAIASALGRHKINGRQLCIEITEDTIIDNIEQTLEIITEIKKLGVLIAIDDFGTGYSSLMQLKKQPLDQLKIDRKLVNAITTDTDTAVIVQTIIAMAKHLGLSVIAEGVETEQQKQLLHKKGCFLYQGYLFSKPLNAKKMISFLEQHQ